MANATLNTLRLNFFYKGYDKIKHHNLSNENPSEHILCKELQYAAKTKDAIAINDKLFAFFQHFNCYEPNK